jgi:beta-glucosidase
MFKKVIRNGFLLSLMLSVCSSCAQNLTKNKSDLNPLYLNPSHPIEKRIEDLMERMTLEDKVYQMNQFVGLDHMKSGNPDDDKENNDFIKHSL